MVDALKEGWRVLHQGGALLDFRPLVSSPPIEIVSDESSQEVGSVDDRQAASDSAAADRAIQTIVESGFLHQMTQSQFRVAYYWNTVGEMSEYLTSRRHPMSILPSEAEVRELFDRTAGVNARARLRCRWENQLNVYTRR